MRRILLPLLLALCGTQCRQFVKSPEQNFIRLELKEFKPKHLSSMSGTVDIVFRFEAFVTAKGAAAPSPVILLQSPPYRLSTQTALQDSLALLPWQVAYSNIQKQILKRKAGDAPIKLTVASQSPFFFNSFSSSITSRSLDFEYLPITKPVRLEFIDKPSATRSLKDATGAKIAVTLQRIVGNPDDAPPPGTYPTIIESWWLKEDSNYEEIAEYHIVMNELFRSAFGERAVSVTLSELQGTIRVDEFRATVEKLVKKRLSQQSREELIAQLDREPTADFDPSRLELMYKWAFTSQSQESIVSESLSKAIRGRLTTLLGAAAKTKVGEAVKTLVVRWLAKDKGEIEALQAEALRLLKKE